MGWYAAAKAAVLLRPRARGATAVAPEHSVLCRGGSSSPLVNPPYPEPGGIAPALTLLLHGAARERLGSTGPDEIQPTRMSELQVSSTFAMHIRRAHTSDTEALVALWHRSVMATHAFLTLNDMERLAPVVRDEVVGGLEVWILEEDTTPIGFLALHGAFVEALFMDPAHMRKGGGRILLGHARSLKGPLTVDVNEQNPQALRFYLAEGFYVAGRSELDGAGRPFPLLHLREP